jgi:murein DD-endopeptidase / murein LD-carboxypeptidase
MRARLTPLIAALFGLLLSACASQPNSETAAVAAPATVIEPTVVITPTADATPEITRTVRSFGEIFASAQRSSSNEQLIQAPSNRTTFASANDANNKTAASQQSNNPTVNRLLARAETLIGTPYRNGGITTRGFDCSGFVNYLFKEEAGINLPRTSRQLMNMASVRVARADLEPGDILLFNRNGRGRVSHTGIYIGDDKFIHSSSHRSGGVRTDSLKGYWGKSYLDAKRVFN